MPEYLHPGVYVEETSYRGKPIQGVSTSTAGFVGAAYKGPEKKPVLVTSLGDFRRKYGDPVSPPEKLGDYLGHAVKAFFENGGSRAYVVRVLAADATAASATIEQGTVLSLRSGTTVRGPTRTIPLNSLRQVEVGSVLHVFTRATASDPFVDTRQLQVASYDALRNRVTVIAADEIPSGVTLEPANTYFLIATVPPPIVPGAPTGPTFRARNRGTEGNRIAVLVRPTDMPPVALTTRTVLRLQPEVDTPAGPIGVGTGNLTLTSAALRRLRTGDTITVGTAAPVAIAAIDAAELSFTIGAGTAANYGIGAGTISLVSRRGTALVPPLVLGAIPAGTFNLTAAIPSPEAACPHDVAAVLLPNDVIRLIQGANQVDLTVTGIRLSQEVAAGAHVTLAGGGVNVAQNGATVSVRLVDTSNANPDLARLIVDNATGFGVPTRAGSPEPIAITNGSDYEASVIRLVDPAINTLYVAKAAAAGQFSSAVTVANWVSLESRQLAADTQLSVAVASTASFYSGATVELDTGTVKYELTVDTVDPGTRKVRFTAGLPLGANVYLDVPASPADRRAYLRTAEIEIQVWEDEVVRETFSRLTWNDDTATVAFRRHFANYLNDPEIGSKLVEVVQPIPPGTGLSNQPTTRNGRPRQLGNGSDGSDLTAIDLIGADNGAGNRSGIEALSERTDISIVAVPGVVEESVQSALIGHCERLKYRFAVLDGKQGTPLVTDIQAHRNNYDTEYAAYYAPWLKTLDLTSGQTILIPPSGYAIGIYARTDNTVGVHKAPANEVVRNITDVEFPFTEGEQDVLNPIGVNLIRDLTPRGIRVWGARTISSDQEWKYVNVRRLFIFLEHSIDIGTQWVVFEPNSESLWARVTETITAFLIGVWKSGALMGTTPEQAFFVRCDRSTMSQDDIDNGRLICEIGVAPVMPAEFVIFRIGQFTADATT